MCGSFQVGKSSTIKKLSGEKSVGIGNGSEEQTKGAYVYGPFPYNYIRKRFGMDEVQDNDTQIFFVDTEGCNGFDTGDTNVEANTFLLSQLIAPYAALSNVLVTLMDKNIRLQEVQANGTLFRIIREVRKGTVDTHFLGVVQNYIIKDDPFDEMRQKVTKIMRKRFGEQSELQDFIPLPFFDPRYDILNQDKKFNDGFNEFAKILLNSLEESRQKCIIDAESAYNMFETLVKRTEDQDLQQLVQKAIENGELSAAERLCLGDVNRIIESKTSIIQKSIKELQDQLKKNPFFEIPQIEIKQNICDAAFHEMESFPESVKKLVIYQDFQNRISNEISTKYEEYYKVIEEIRSKQITLLKHSADTIFDNLSRIELVNISNNNLTELPDILEACRNNLKNSFIKTFKNEIYNVCKVKNNTNTKPDLSTLLQTTPFKEIIFDDVQKDLLQYLTQTLNNQMNKFYEPAQKRSEENKNKQFETLKILVNDIINTEVANFKTNSFNKPTTNNTIKNIRDDITHKYIEELNNYDKNIQKISEDTLSKLKNYGSEKLSEHIQEITEFIKMSIKERQENFKAYANAMIKDFINNKHIELQRRFKESNETDSLKIFTEETINAIKSEYTSLARQICKDKNAKEEDLQNLFKDGFTDLNSLIQNLQEISECVAQSNLENKINSKKLEAEEIIDLEINYQMQYIQANNNIINIKNINFYNMNHKQALNMYTNDGTNNFLEYIKHLCIHEIRLSDIHDQNMKNEIEKFIKDYSINKVNEVNEKIMEIANENIIKAADEKENEIILTIKRIKDNLLAEITKRNLSEFVDKDDENDFKNECINKCDEIIKNVNVHYVNKLKIVRDNSIDNNLSQIKIAITDTQNKLINEIEENIELIIIDSTKDYVQELGHKKDKNYANIFSNSDERQFKNKCSYKCEDILRKLPSNYKNMILKF